ncbi:hypothetical protein [Cellulomonas palmilytica]|uniref:hypothetical protein n=1 Tax=Cellulomonas palmilytica TaxID=2608402 RepID=UPI001F281BF6|nr:hypothetical protein [Cellulomonas palmilytica]UJP40658.1 hypothetical protein F1D97_03910 [Cellulomonas palmilytica]
MTVYDDERAAYDEAAHWFATTTRLAAGRWTEPGLGEWDVRALVGHTSRALLTVEAYLANPAPAVEVATTADYYAATRAATTGPQVAQRGRDAGAALGAPAEPPPSAAASALRVLSALAVQGRAAGALLLAATGRGPLPDQFSIL